MSIGASIFLLPSDRSWIGTPEFIRGLTKILGAQSVQSFQVYRRVRPPQEGGNSEGEQEEEKIADLANVPVEQAIELQSHTPECMNVMRLADSEALKRIGQEVDQHIPHDVSEGFAPIEVTLYNGRWEHFEYNTGEPVARSSFCLELGNHLGYPVELDAYLEAFLRVPGVAELRAQMEAASGRTFNALIDLV